MESARRPDPRAASARENPSASEPRAPSPSVPWEALGRGAALHAEVLWASGFALDHPGAVRERYVVERPLGRGAMGQVLAVRLVSGDDPATEARASTPEERAASLRGEVYALKVVARPADANALRAPTRSLAPRLTPPPPAPAPAVTASARHFDPADSWAVDDGPVEPASALPSVIVEPEISEAEQRTTALTELLRSEAARQDLARRHGVSVARLFALVRLADGSLGMRMELARGRSLEQWLRRESAQRDRAPDVAFSARVARRLLSQLRRLHRLDDARHPGGFVHSDVKPGNVFVDDTDPSDPQVTLLDFGVSTAGGMLVAGAALLGETAASSSARGSVSQGAGTAGFEQSLVLEQAGGTLGYAPPGHFSLPPTPVSDAYAALVLFYECVTLELPWEAGATAWRPEHLPQLEEAMRRGPRPVRAVRGSISAAAARVLDGFFAREFAALHKLCDVGLDARARGDTARWQRAVYSLDLAGRGASRIEQLATALERATRAPTPAPSSTSTTAPLPLQRLAQRISSSKGPTISRVPPLVEAAPTAMPEAATDAPFVFGAPSVEPTGAAPALVHTMNGAPPALRSVLTDEPLFAPRAPRVEPPPAQPEPVIPRAERETVPLRAVVAAAPAATPPPTRSARDIASMPPPSGIELARPSSVPPPGMPEAHPARRPLRAVVALAALGLSSLLLSVGSRDRISSLRQRALASPEPEPTLSRAPSTPAPAPAVTRPSVAPPAPPAVAASAAPEAPSQAERASEDTGPSAEPTHEHHPLGCSSPVARTSIELRGNDGRLRGVLCVTDRANAHNAGGTMGVGDAWDPARDEELATAHREGRLRCVSDEVPAGSLRASLGRLDDEGGPSGWVVRCRTRTAVEAAHAPAVPEPVARTLEPHTPAAEAAAVGASVVQFTPAPEPAAARAPSPPEPPPRAEVNPQEHEGAQVPTSGTSPAETP